MRKPHSVLWLRLGRLEVWHFRMALSAILSAMGY
jgi:hypothetical protein